VTAGASGSAPPAPLVDVRARELSVAVGELENPLPLRPRPHRRARLADCLGLSGDVAARNRYDPVLRLAEELGDVDAQLLVLDNRAYCETVVGAFEEAQATLDECVRRCDEYGLSSIRARPTGTGGAVRRRRRIPRRLREHRLYTDELMYLQSAERDARARALQAMYETTDARRRSRRYRELSLRDPLTGLYNRRYVDDQLPRLLEKAAAGAESVTVALLDLDHFKRIDDTRSHEAGDQVLCAVAELLEAAGSSAGTGSFVARMARSSSWSRPGPTRRRLRHGWRTSAVRWPVTPGTSSWATSRSPSASGRRAAGARPPSPPADNLGRADGHLYLAERQGRDRVVSDPV
jgi:two-component system, cell cycle response regulator